ncbi:MAG: AMP-binding protein [Anaerolineales bacterium]|nr:AMP-binding protein [Anaerolineales bacterium]
MDIYSKFEQNAQKHPDKPAFIYWDKKQWQTLTYADILDQSERFFRGLRAGSLAPGMTAAVMTPPSAAFFPFALALLKFGIVPIILDPAVGLRKVGEILAESQPDIFIGNELTHALRILFGWGRESIKHNLSIAKIESGKWKAQPSSTFHSTLPTDTVAIIYTSGSTGLPKGAVYSQGNLSAQLDLLQAAFDISPDEIDLPAFPLYALIDLLLGVTSVIPDITFPVPGKTDPEKVINAIQKFNVTNMFASPVVLEILSKYNSTLPVKLSSLKRIITAGAPATIDLQKGFRQLLDEHTDLFGIYGATETLPIAKVESREIFALKEKTEHGAGICLGKPIDGVTVRIIPIRDEPIEEWQDSLAVESNVVGEITVQSPATTRSYIHRPDADRISKIPGHCEDDSPKQSNEPIQRDEAEVIHRMGDVGYFDEEGRLWYCGRKSHRVITKDGVMFTEQIENIFNAHPQVYRTALVGVDGEPIVWVEIKSGAKADKEKVIEELKSLGKTHPQASRIQRFLFIKKFPTDVRHNSKIIREKLAQLITDN